MIPLDTRRRRAIQRRVIDWFARAARRLPWREAPTAYHVWICEIMAQQTRLQVVAPRFESFVEKFPTVTALAQAPVDEVLAAWSGLGYYRRARALHAAARAIHERHEGVVPSDPEVLAALPGIGRYTAGAISSIAYGAAVPAVDGNVMRVLSRVFDLARDIQRSRTRRALWDLAARLVPADDPGGFNQGLMELGALVCTPLGPACRECPLGRLCRARRAGTVVWRPVRSRRRPPRPVRILAGAVREPRGALLLVQNDYEGLFGGLWQLPIHTMDGARAGKTALGRALSRALGVEVRVGPSRGKLEHLLTHRQLQVEIHDCRVPGRRIRAPSYRAHRWVRTEQDLAGLALPALTRRILDKIEAW